MISLTISATGGRFFIATFRVSRGSPWPRYLGWEVLKEKAVNKTCARFPRGRRSPSSLLLCPRSLAQESEERPDLSFCAMWRQCLGLGRRARGLGRIALASCLDLLKGCKKRMLGQMDFCGFRSNRILHYFLYVCMYVTGVTSPLF